VIKNRQLDRKELQAKISNMINKTIIKDKRFNLNDQYLIIMFYINLIILLNAY